MSENSIGVRFLYGTKLGRLLLRLIQKSRTDRLIVRFLRSPFSRPLIGLYIKHNKVPMMDYREQSFRTFRDFFARKRYGTEIDLNPKHLISPCEGYLSAYQISEDSYFSIKGSHYHLRDFMKDSGQLYQRFYGGTCLVFRLTPADYHHYCFIDNGYQGENHYIAGTLHSIQPIACAQYPVYTMNRRVWTCLATENFGSVIQVEIGALIVGGIFNEIENSRFYKGMEKGHFELAGSTIVLLFEEGQMQLKPEILEKFSITEEVRVKQGEWIGTAERRREHETWYSL